MQDSIFTKIIKGEIPCHKVFEDERTIAFLDIHPLQPGHTLVVSKAQVDHLWDLPDDDYAAVMAAAKKVANRLREVLKPERVGVKVVGVDVPHAHVHLIPFSTLSQYEGHEAHTGEPDHAALAALANRLRIEQKVSSRR